MKAATLPDRPDFSLMKLNDVISYYHLQMPRWLFADSRYKLLALESKVAYTFLLNRFQLSRMNGWINDAGEVFIIFTRQELADEMQISFRKAIECFQELVSAKLIWDIQTRYTLQRSSFLRRMHRHIQAHPLTKKQDMRILHIWSPARHAETTHQEMRKWHIWICQNRRQVILREFK